MKDEQLQLKDCVTLAAVMIAVALALPLLGLAAFVLRFALVAAAGLLVATALVCAVIPRFRQRMLSVVEPELSYKGLRLATDVGLGPAHAWARVEPDGAFVGADDIAEACLGPVERVALPVPGQRVARGEHLFALQRGSRRLDIPSPVQGEVITANEALEHDPQRINRDPFGLGWVARLRPDEPRQSRRALLHGFRAQDWFRSEVDRLVSAVDAGPVPMPTMPDGGAVVDGLYRLIDEATWAQLQQSLFGPLREAGKEAES